MPAVTSLTIYGAARFSRAVTALGGRLAQRVKQVVRSIRNRRDAAKLARLDDRMLADIGVTRSDLRDAYSESLWRDPTDVLARRAAERRVSRRRVAFDRSAPKPGCAPCYPPLDRPAQYLM